MFTERPILDGRPQTVARLIRFRFPKELLQPGDDDERQLLDPSQRSMPVSEVQLLQQNDVVAFTEDEDAALLIVDSVHLEQGRISGRQLEPTGEGPWPQQE